MKYLLDTHVLIWCLLDRKKLNPKILNILEDSKNQCFVSSVSFWELSLKFSIGKLILEDLTPEMFPDLALDMGFKLLELGSSESANFHQLKGEWHKDPFDRMLIVQAIKNNLTLITKDENITKYKEEGLKTLW